jgi:hypothetical protein
VELEEDVPEDEAVPLGVLEEDEELLLEGVADADDELEGVELEEDEPDEDDVPLGVLDPDEEPLLDGVADEDEVPLGVLEPLELPELLETWMRLMNPRGWSSTKRSRMMRRNHLECLKRTKSCCSKVWLTKTSSRWVYSSHLELLELLGVLEELDGARRGGAR